MTEELSAQTDETLMGLYMNVNEQAFSLLYTRYSARVYGYLRLLFGYSRLSEMVS